MGKDKKGLQIFLQIIYYCAPGFFLFRKNLYFGVKNISL